MKLFLRSITVVALAAFAPLALSQSIDWTNTGPDNSFDNGLNWTSAFSTGTVPGPGDDTHIFPGFEAVADPDISDILVAPGGPLVINISTSNNQNIGGLLVASNFAGTTLVGTLNLNLNSGSTLTIGAQGTRVLGSVTLNFAGNMTMPSGFFIVGSNDFFDGGLVTGSGTVVFGSGTTNLDGATSLIIGQDGGTGTVTQGAGSTVTVGQTFEIGESGGTGTYNLTNGAILNIGTQGAALSGSYFIGVGANSDSNGTLLISGSSTLNATNNGTIMAIGEDFGDVGVVTQSGNSTVNLGGGGLVIGGSGTGTYNLLGGTLNLTNAETAIGFESTFGEPGTGTLNQTAGTLSASSQTTFTLGFSGTGTYNLSGGTADFQGGLILGGNVGSGALAGTGTINQTNGVLTTENVPAEIGVNGIGVYNLSGGSATFNDGLIVGSTGTLNLSGGSFSLGTGGNTLVVQSGGIVNQTATTVILDSSSGFTLDLSAGGIYNLNGGILQTRASGFSAGTGILNFGGGTLLLTGGGTFTDPFTTTHTLASGTLSTIDATTVDPINGAFTSATLGSLTGGGGINLAGINGTTNFSFTGTNDYTGETRITSGTLTTSASNVAFSDLLNVVSSGSVLNLNVDLGGAALLSGLAGDGQINVTFAQTNDALVLKSASNFNGSINLGAGGTAGQLQVYSGTLNNVTDASTNGNNLVVGGNTLAPFPDGSTAPTNGTVTMTNSLFRGTTSVASQFTLNAISQPGNLSSSTAIVNIGGTTTNDGTLTVIGTIGNVSGSSTVSYVGVNGDVTNSGTFLVGQSVGTVAAGSTVSLVDVQGTLTNNASGTFGSNDTLSTPGAVTAHIGGDLVSTGTLNIRVLGAASDLFKVDGAANLTDSKISLTGSATLGTHLYEIVNATGGVTDTNVTTNPDTALFSYSLAPIDPLNPNILDLSVTQKAIASYALTPNQRAVANALDNTPGGNTIKSAFNTLTPAQGPTVIPVALDQLSPEVYQYARNIAFENSTFLAQSMNGVMANIRNGYSGIDSSGLGFITPGFGNGLGRSLGNLVAANDPYHQTAPNGVNYYPDTGASVTPAPSPYSAPSPWAGTESSGPISDSPMPLHTSASPPAMSAPSFSGFISGDVVLADLNQNNGVGNAPPGKADYTGADLLTGVAYHMTSHFSAGVLFDYNHTDASTDANGSKTKIDTYSPGVFATFYDQNFYLNGLFSVGFNDYSNTRDIPFARSTATSSPTGQQYVTNLDTGYDFHPARQWTVGPTLGLTYTHLDIGSFHESGAGQASLSVQDQHADSLRSRLGGHVTYEARVGSMVLQPNLFVAWQHEYLDQANGITSQFSIPGSGPFTIQTTAPGSDTALVGIGLTASLDNSMVLYLNYMADAGADDYFAQSIMAGFKASF